MISKKALNQYNFSDLEQYFNYILESEINGQFEQVESLILSLSKPQRVEFLEWALTKSSDISYRFNAKVQSVYHKCSKILKS